MTTKINSLSGIRPKMPSETQTCLIELHFLQPKTLSISKFESWCRAKTSKTKTTETNLFITLHQKYSRSTNQEV
jgi:hypothetical protein